jgi:hypothetical protein
MLRARLALGSVALTVLLGAAAASWTSTSTGAAAAKAASLGAGSKPTATKSGVVTLSVIVSWTATPGASGYIVHRTGGVGTLGGNCTGTLTTTTCTDSPVPPLQTYTYTITPVRGAWTGPASAGTSINT